MPAILLGIVFVASGLTKVIEIEGMSKKTEEYLMFLRLFDMYEYSMILSVLLCLMEIGLGLMLLLRIWPKVSSVAALLLMLGFTVLTYMLFTDPFGGITECGCFGKLLSLSPKVTFIKNLILSGLAIYNCIVEYCNKKYGQPDL